MGTPGRSSGAATFVSVAGNSAALVTRCRQCVAHGRMTPQMRTALHDGLAGDVRQQQRVMTVLYLTAMSGDYLIQH